MLTQLVAVASPDARNLSHSTVNTVESSSPDMDHRVAVERAAGEYGAAKRHWGEDDPRTQERRDELAVVKVSSAIQRILDKAAPLSEQRRSQLRAVIATIISEPDQESA
jgi:hypothetical protein